MKNYFFIALLLAGLCSCQEAHDLNRETDFNFNWKFTLENNASSDEIPIPDEDWRDIRLPHDWSVEASFDSTLEGCTGYLPGGIGWYQKHFRFPSKSREIIVYLWILSFLLQYSLPVEC